MLDQHTIYMDDLSDALTLASGDDVVWPDIEIELGIKWHPPEPDVGIFDSQPEIKTITYYLAGDKYADEASFVQALYAGVGQWYEEDEATFAELIANRITNEELAQ